jgi:hypothetical protein
MSHSIGFAMRDIFFQQVPERKKASLSNIFFPHVCVVGKSEIEKMDVVSFKELCEMENDWAKYLQFGTFVSEAFYSRSDIYFPINKNGTTHVVQLSETWVECLERYGDNDIGVTSEQVTWDPSITSRLHEIFQQKAFQWNTPSAETEKPFPKYPKLIEVFGEGHLAEMPQIAPIIDLRTLLLTGAVKGHSKDGNPFVAFAVKGKHKYQVIQLNQVDPNKDIWEYDAAKKGTIDPSMWKTIKKIVSGASPLTFIEQHPALMKVFLDIEPTLANEARQAFNDPFKDSFPYPKSIVIVTRPKSAHVN